MAKVPEMGRVKTRLARSVGAVDATRFYRLTVAAVVARLGRDRRWTTSLAIAPDTGCWWHGWPRGIDIFAQGSGDLGRRMQRIMDAAWPGPVLIVGTDIPGLQPGHIAAAFRLLRRSDAILGPAPDGGYWLVGLRRSPRIPRPFDGVRWSSTHARADTAANLAPRRVAEAATLADVDDEVALTACRAWFGRRVLPRS